MAEELSLIISNPTKGEFLKKIDWNKEQFKEKVAAKTEEYRGLVYTEETMKTAKEDRAELNKMKNDISDIRKEVKKAIMEPYTQFENEVKEVTALIDEPIAMIDAQIKEYEERVKNEKKQQLETHFNEVVAELNGILTFDKIFDSKWLNVSTSLKKAKEEIDNQIEVVRMGLRSIDNLCEEKYHTVLKDFYTRTLNITKTMDEYSRLREMDRKLEEEKVRKAEEARLKAEQEAKKEEISATVTETVDSVVEQTQTETAVEPPVEQPEVVDAFVQPEKQYKASFTVYGTKDQIMALKQYMIDNKIRYEK